ncbi:hypothetical protein [Eubacterium limosum]|uniref:hypothetical protein n=1 Tax=Eubacterium limosum TaxID=1736 RepID=UPI0022E668B3|nr:hypothetical protein [Eubacterium limosum]
MEVKEKLELIDLARNYGLLMQKAGLNHLKDSDKFFEYSEQASQVYESIWHLLFPELQDKAN